MFRSAQHDREFGLAGARRSRSVSVFSGSTAHSKLENDFAAALALRRMSNRRFRFAERISFFDFCFQQTAFCDFEQRLEGFHSLLLSLVVVPLVEPAAASTKVFENEKAVRNFQRLQTHRPKCDPR